MARRPGPGRAARRRVHRHLPLPGRTTGPIAGSLPRRRRVREGATARARGSTWRARRSAAAASRWTSSCRPGTPPIPAAATRSSTSCTACPGRPVRFLATVRMGVVQDEFVAPHRRAADDPRDAVRLDRVVHRRGMGERSPALRARAGRPSSRVTSCARSTRATGRSAAVSARALAGLSEGGYGALEHRHPPSGRVSGAREPVRLPARRRHRLDLRPSHRAAAPQQPAGRRSARQPPLSAGHTRTIWFYSGTGDRELATEPALRAAAHGPRACATASSSSAAATTGRSGVAMRRARLPGRAREGFVARRALGVPVLLLGLDCGDAAGCTWCGPRCPDRGSPDALPLDELARHSAAPLLCTSSCGARPARRSASMPAGRGWTG